MSTPRIVIAPITAAVRHEKGAPYRFRHGWIPIGRGDDSVPGDRKAPAGAVRAARSEARQRLDAALERLDRENPELGRRRRERLNELRKDGKLTPDRMRIETDAANRLAMPSGHAHASKHGDGLGDDRFGHARNRDAGNGGHGGTGGDTKPASSVRGDSAAAKNARRAVHDLSGAGPEDQQRLLRRMSDVELRNTHEAIRAQHRDAQGSVDKAALKKLSDLVRAEHTRRKSLRASSGAPLSIVAAFNPDQARNLSGEKGGEWTAQPPTPAEKDAAANDEEAKQLFLQLMGMSPDQQAAFLKTLSKDKLQRLGTFAYLGSGDTQITAIRDSIFKEVTARGGDPVSIGAAPKKGKAGAKGAKKPAAGKKSGSSGKSSVGKSGGSHSSGSKSSSSSSKAKKPTAAKKTTTSKPKVTVKTGKQPAPGPVLTALPDAAKTAGPKVTVGKPQQDIATGRIPVRKTPHKQPVIVARRSR